MTNRKMAVPKERILMADRLALCHALIPMSKNVQPNNMKVTGKNEKSFVIRPYTLVTMIGINMNSCRQ